MAVPFMALDPQSRRDSLDRTQARSMVITERGIVATSQTLASQAGAVILARGGSAADAAIAADAVLGVVEPMNSGIGGDLFSIFWDSRTSKLAGLNSSGWAPRKLTPEFLRSEGINHMPQEGIYSVTVPAASRAGRISTRNSVACPGPSCSSRQSITPKTGSR